jgi:hypothetical protein
MIVGRILEWEFSSKGVCLYQTKRSLSKISISKREQWRIEKGCKM